MSQMMIKLKYSIVKFMHNNLFLLSFSQSISSSSSSSASPSFSLSPSSSSFSSFGGGGGGICSFWTANIDSVLVITSSSLSGSGTSTSFISSNCEGIADGGPM